MKQQPQVQNKSSYYDSEEDDSFATNNLRVPDPPPIVPGLKLGAIQGLNLPTNNEQYVSRTARIVERNVPLARKDLPQLNNNDSEDIIQRQITILKHKQLQLKFMGEENSNLQEQVAHLQQVIKGFKTLFTDNNTSSLIGQMEQRITSVTKENQELIAKSLLDQQVVQAVNQKFADYSEATEQQISNLTAQLDRKEYQMQRMELKVYNYEKYLQRKALSDHEAIALLKKFEARISESTERRVTNVVEDNNNLRRELKEAMEEINRLENINQQLQSRVSLIFRKGGELFDDQAPDVSMSELDYFQTINANDVIRNTEEGGDQLAAQIINDFASGMSSIPIGVKQKVPLLVEKEKACKTVEEENSDTDDINIIDI